ncbi:MAG: hypothetical protein WDM79_18990 [Terricaulis sp.]
MRQQVENLSERHAPLAWRTPLTASDRGAEHRGRFARQQHAIRNLCEWKERLIKANKIAHTARPNA